MTTVVVWEGRGEAWGERSNFALRAGDAVSFYSSDLRDHEMYALPQGDRFDNYCMTRDRRLNQSVSLRYVDDDLIGYAELDEYGIWGNTRDYGNVWYPTQVAANWAPYRDGHWVWQEPWGWTWVDDAPWGFAPSHYGRWVSVSGRWGWLPGPRNVRPVYAPALVAFVGGSDWGLSISLDGSSRGGSSRIGWFPLGPRDVYMPSYRSSREYFTQVNVSNTVVNTTTITTVYNNYSSGNINVAQTNYVNRGMASAVTAVPGDVFRNSQPVGRARLDLDQRVLAETEIMNLAPLAPSARSIAGSAAGARVKPSPEAFDRNVYARNAPPPGQLPFADRQERLQRNPGMAVEPTAKPTGNANSRAREHVRVIAAGIAADDARAAGPRRDADEPAGGKPTQLRPLDRAAGNQLPQEPPGRSRESDGANTKPPVVATQPSAIAIKPQATPPAAWVKEPPAAKPRDDDAVQEQRARQAGQIQREAEQSTQRQATEQQRQQKPTPTQQRPPDPDQGKKPPKQNPDKPAADNDDDELDANGNPKSKNKRGQRP
jgi:hypothetical protein